MNGRGLFLGAAVAALLVAGSSAALAQPGGGGPGRGGTGGRGGIFFGGGFGGVELLRQDDVRKELEIVDEQETKIRELGDKMREEMQQLWSGLRDLGEEDRRKKFEENREKMQTMMDDLKKKVDEVLLPHQRERLKQLQVQSRLRFQGTVGAVGDGELAEALGITDEQKQKLQEKAKDVEQELEEKIAKLREEAREKLLSVLEPEQREKFKKMVGEPFRFQTFRPQGGPPPREGERREGQGESNRAGT